MTDRRIIFSAPMVRALLDGRKTMTRRLAWHGRCPICGYSREDMATHGDHRLCSGPGPRPTIWQKVRPGDRLYVQEGLERSGGLVQYVANRQTSHHLWRNHWTKDWQPGRFCPREFSRLTLVVTETKMERVQEISHNDAVAEGMGIFPHSMSAEKRFSEVWNTLHKPGNRWEDNPEVVALTFTVHKANIDRLEAAKQHA